MKNSGHLANVTVNITAERRARDWAFDPSPVLPGTCPRNYHRDHLIIIIIIVA